VICQLDATRSSYWCILSSTYFGYIHPPSGALDIELQRMVFWAEFVDEWWSWELLHGLCVWCGWHNPHRTHDPCSGSQDHHSSTNSAQKTIRCNSTSNAPDDEHILPKHVELRIHQWNYLVASSWLFTLFHEEDARSNNPQIIWNFQFGELKYVIFTRYLIDVCTLVI